MFLNTNTLQDTHKQCKNSDFWLIALRVIFYFGNSDFTLNLIIKKCLA